MGTPHYRKIDLQSSADLSYLHANTTVLSRQKLDLHLPPSASNNEPDPMRERVRELVDDVLPHSLPLFCNVLILVKFITRTFQTASSSISVNGLDAPPSISSKEAQAQSQTRETVEYEPYDTRLAARVTSLYAQLESLTTAVAQLRRDAPGRAAREYADLLRKVVDDEEEEEEEIDFDSLEEEGGKEADAEMIGSDEQQRHRGRLRQGWKLDIPLGTENEASRWREGDMALVYEDALRTLLSLQGEGAGSGDDDKSQEGTALASTVGKAERAGKAVEVVENT